MATTPCDGQSLAAAARCLSCQIPPGEQMAVLIYLYCQLAGMANCDGQTLAQAARCLSCQIPPGEQLAVLVYLACQQLAGGGGAVATNIIVGAALTPVTPPATTTSPAIYYSDTANPTLAVWSVANQAWVVLIAGS